MEMKVYDNLFTDKFLLELYECCVKLPWNLSNTANRNQYPDECITTKGSHLIFGTRLFYRESYYSVRNYAPRQLFDVLEYFISDHLKEDLFLDKIDCNLQVMGQNGTSHKDIILGNGIDRTIIFYPHYKWDENWGGELEILEENKVVEKIFPAPGRVLFFDSSVTHRALAPKIPNLGRMSIAYRMGKM